MAMAARLRREAARGVGEHDGQRGGVALTMLRVYCSWPGVSAMIEAPARRGEVATRPRRCDALLALGGEASVTRERSSPSAPFRAVVRATAASGPRAGFERGDRRWGLLRRHGPEVVNRSGGDSRSVSRVPQKYLALAQLHRGAEVCRPSAWAPRSVTVAAAGSPRRSSPRYRRPRTGSAGDVAHRPERTRRVTTVLASCAGGERRHRGRSPPRSTTSRRGEVDARHGELLAGDVTADCPRRCPLEMGKTRSLALVQPRVLRGSRAPGVGAGSIARSRRGCERMRPWRALFLVARARRRGRRSRTRGSCRQRHGLVRVCGFRRRCAADAPIRSIRPPSARRPRQLGRARVAKATTSGKLCSVSMHERERKAVGQTPFGSRKHHDRVLAAGRGGRGWWVSATTSRRM